MAVDPVQSFETFEATISLFNPFGLKANEYIAHHHKELKSYVMLCKITCNGSKWGLNPLVWKSGPSLEKLAGK